MKTVLGLLAVVLSVALALAGCAATSEEPEVEETIWILESFADESVPVNSYGQTMPSFELADEEVWGTIGVNRFTAAYELSGDEISFSEVASTELPGPPEAVEQEEHFIAALEAAASVEVRDRTLTISDSNGAVLMVLTEALEG